MLQITELLIIRSSPRKSPNSRRKSLKKLITRLTRTVPRKSNHHNPTTPVFPLTLEDLMESVHSRTSSESSRASEEWFDAPEAPEEENMRAENERSGPPPVPALRREVTSPSDVEKSASQPKPVSNSSDLAPSNFVEDFEPKSRAVVPPAQPSPPPFRLIVTEPNVSSLFDIKEPEPKRRPVFNRARLAPDYYLLKDLKPRAAAQDPRDNFGL